jgi:hypothetical protein
MGWDGLLDALADREEAGDEEHFSSQGSSGVRDEYLDFEEEESDADDFEDIDDDDEEDSFTDEEEDHPLQARAQELAMRAMDVIERDAGPGTPSYLLITNLLQVSGKLAGVLYGRNTGYQPEAGFVLAVLKRCLNWLNEAVGACQQLTDLEHDPDQRAALEHIRSSIFEIRDGIVEMRRELK